MAALWNRAGAGHYIFILSFVLSVWGTPANFNGFSVLAPLLRGTVVVGVSQTWRRWIEGATYIRQGGHHVGHWSTFLVYCCFICCFFGVKVNMKSFVVTSCTEMMHSLEQMQKRSQRDSQLSRCPVCLETGCRTVVMCYSWKWTQGARRSSCRLIYWLARSRWDRLFRVFQLRSSLNLLQHLPSLTSRTTSVLVRLTYLLLCCLLSTLSLITGNVDLSTKQYFVSADLLSSY